MATINTPQIRELYFHLSTIDIIIKEKSSLVNGNKSNLEKIIVSDAKNNYSQKQDTAKMYIDKVNLLAYENGIVALVSTFEKLIFDMYDTSKGEIKKTIENNTPTQIPYYKSRKKVVREMNNLADIINLIEGTIDEDVFKQLKQIKEYRDYIAHGKRFGSVSPYTFKLEEIALILDKIIIEIK